MTRAKSAPLVNLAAFNLSWYVCVGRADLVGPLVVAWTLVPHFALVAADAPRRSARTLAVAALAGTVLDSALEQIGMLSFAGGPRLGPLCPLWITALWVNFATTAHGCLRWLRPRLGLAAVLGGVAVPLTYLLAERLDAVTLHAGALVALGFQYAVLTPALLVYAHPPGRAQEAAEA